MKNRNDSIPASQRLKKIKTQLDYEYRLKEHSRYYKKFKQMTKNGKVSLAAQEVLRYVNTQYRFIRQWEKDNGIQRFPPIKVGNTTYYTL